MSTETISGPDSEDGWRGPFVPEHLSLLPVLGAVGAVVSGVENGWALATVFLSVAYLVVYLQSRL